MEIGDMAIYNAQPTTYKSHKNAAIGSKVKVLRKWGGLVKVMAPCLLTQRGFCRFWVRKDELMADKTSVLNVDKGVDTQPAK